MAVYIFKLSGMLHNVSTVGATHLFLSKLSDLAVDGINCSPQAK